MSEIFPTKTCTRCGGGGEYSYNQIDGTVCYGCNGSGKMWASKQVSTAVDAYSAELRQRKQPTASKLAVGDLVLDDLSYRANGSQKWSTVTDITVTDEVCVWSGVDRTPTSWFLMITLADGTVHKVSGNHVVRRHAGSVDVTPFLKMAGIA